MTSQAGRCAYCEQVIDPDYDFRRVTGWERRREQGGTNALRCREPLDLWACRLCVDKLAAGIPQTQERLAF